MKQQKQQTLIANQIYAVRSGRFKGRVGKAVQTGSLWEIHALWFPDTDETISWFGNHHTQSQPPRNEGQ